MPVTLTVTQKIARIELERSSVFQLNIHLNRTQFSVKVIDKPDMMAIGVIQTSMTHKISPHFKISCSFILNIIPWRNARIICGEPFEVAVFGDLIDSFIDFLVEVCLVDIVLHVE